VVPFKKGEVEYWVNTGVRIVEVGNTSHMETNIFIYLHRIETPKPALKVFRISYRIERYQ